ncbi:MAG TPA: site-2 protease family protein [Terriglobia bacterium]|nr:site-2 protease family protein [Terriglobia bacterium]
MRDVKAALRLGRVKGIEVFVHWSWFVVAIYELSARRTDYSSLMWNAFEYLALFAIVTLHEFGHALACLSTGGRANRIMLWPLGGVAYVSPPPRPGALLWSIAAGPLVNAVLIPIAGVLVWLSSSSGFAAASPNAHMFLRGLMFMNIGLFVFNMLPIYPLDGGQILRSLLWFVIGRARSLMVTSLLGFLGVGALILLALVAGLATGSSGGALWLFLIALFAGMQCLNGFRASQSLQRLAAVPRRPQYQCPTCQTAPPSGAYWRCGSCGKGFDPFMPRQSRATGFGLGLGLPRDTPTVHGPLDQAAPCMECGARSPETDCVDCGAYHPFNDWRRGEPVGAAPATGPAPPVGFATGVAVAPAAPAPRMAPAPSVATAVFGVIAIGLAVVSALFALLFFIVSAQQSADAPRVQAAIDRLWLTAGTRVPGQGNVFLSKAGVYQVYLETNDDDESKGSALDIGVADSNARPVTVNPPELESFHRGSRELLPKGSFFVSTPGLYVFRVTTPYRGSDDARIKIGPAAGFARDLLAGIGWAMTFAATVLALALAAAGVLLLRRYWKRRGVYKLSMRSGLST